MNRLEALRQIAAQLQHADIVFPTSAAVSLRIRDALDDPDVHLGAATSLIKAEPLLSARLVAMANSASYRRSDDDVTDVATAVSRIGLRTVRTMAQALIVRQLAGAPKSAQASALATRLWEHTAHVASLSRMLARRVTRVDAETALFTGLVHDAGNFYLLSRTAEFPALLEADCSEEAEAFEVEVHRGVARTLALPEPVSEALEVVWSGYVASPATSLGDTVALAKELAPVATPMIRAAAGRGIAPIDRIVGEEQLSDILRAAAKEVDSLTRALAA